MKKRNLILIAVMVAAFALLAVTVSASARQYEGYEAMKKLMDKQKEFDNGTFELSISVADNGIVVGELYSVVKLDKLSSKLSGNLSMQIDGIQKTGQMFGDKDSIVFVDTQNDLYYSVKNTEKWNDDYYENEYDRGYEKMTAQEEAFLDYLVGSYKEKFELATNTDGTQKIVFSLNEKDIPVSLNLLAAAAASRGHEDDVVGQEDIKELQDLPFFKDIKLPKEIIPQLVNSVKIKGIQLSVSTNTDNQIENIDFEYAVEGRDKEGKFHSIAIQGNIALKAIDQTTVDSIDLTGKTVEDIKTPGRHNR